MAFLSWLRGRSEKSLPSAQAEPDRYKGRPLLLVMENYVLDCIGELGQDKQEGIRKIVQKVWSGSSDWKQTVREQLHLQPAVDENIRQMWDNNKRIAKDNSTTLDPIQFAKMVVDKNFSKGI
jgi:hypothetical protein